MADFSSWNLSNIKRDVIIANHECTQRGLMHSSKWAAEIMYALDEVSLVECMPKFEETEDFMLEFDRYTLAMSYFNLKEYDRAAHFVENCTSDKAYFLHLYATYEAGEKKRLDDIADSTATPDNADNQHLKNLRADLYKGYRKSKLDGFCLYLYGVVLKKLDLLSEATEIFVEAINKQPLHWGAWMELTLLVTGKDMLENLSLPDHWIKQLFIAHTYLGLQLNEEALTMYQSLSEHGLGRSTYIMAQIAMAYHNLKEVDLAVEAYGKLQKVDPFRLDNMDTYSNLLYVKELRADLAYLAHHCSDIDKFRVQTCAVIGNYYSLRSEHETAVLYFQRALKLNPNYLSAWTLMGHEYMELKNPKAAIQAYRKAIEVNRRDYRAWYGLGQTYEIMRMPFYSLYYYRQAQVLRPNDARMVVALGEVYEKLERLQEAKKCYWKAHSLGDVEGLAFMRLAKLYEKLNEEEQAAAAYTEYISKAEYQALQSQEDCSNAYRYLAQYHLKHNRLETAYAAAQKCTEYNETREEGKALLRQISQLRARGEGVNMNEPESTETMENAPNSRPGSPTQSTPQSRLFPMSLTYTP